jgi:hypothetical protein
MVTFNTDASIDFSSAVGTWRSEKKVHSLGLGAFGEHRRYRWIEFTLY